jgi:hypothetical protein
MMMTQAEMSDGYMNTTAICKALHYQNINTSWIYISDKMKLEYLTTEGTNKADTSSALWHVNNRIVKPFITRDYTKCKNISKSEMMLLITSITRSGDRSYINLPSYSNVVKDNHRKTYTLTTGDYFKIMMMNSKTTSGSIVKNYIVT